MIPAMLQLAAQAYFDMIGFRPGDAKLVAAAWYGGWKLRIISRALIGFTLW